VTRFANTLGFAALLMLAAPARAQTVAVLPFENGGSYGQDKEDFDALRQSIAALIASEIGRRSSAQVVQRAAVVSAMRQHGFATTERFDAASAAELGKLTGAGILIAGTFIDLYGDFRIDARIVDVETGRVLKLVRSDPKLSDRSQMFRIIESVAARIVEGAGLAANGAPARTTAVSTEAVTLFGKGLMYEDAGDRSQATTYFQRATAASAGFTEAEAGLRRVGGSG